MSRAICFLRAANVEVVLLLRQDDDRLGGHAGQEVGVVEPESQCMRRALLGVLRKLVLQVPPHRRDEASRRGHRPATVHPQSHVVIVPPPELPVTPTCFGSTSGRDSR